jgi:hypothetical protein
LFFEKMLSLREYLQKRGPDFFGSSQTVVKLDQSELVYSFLFCVGSEIGLLISVPGASLSAGLALSLLVALLLRGLTCPAEPAGVFAPSTPINRFTITNLELYLCRQAKRTRFFRVLLVFSLNKLVLFSLFTIWRLLAFSWIVMSWVCPCFLTRHSLV